ncbi:MAG: type II secretion system major pseudopilin GspG [Spirochaetaceae bacterium]|nr:type II secretion system major pseudopilin GspG [Spirochaetaceae bacterium]
MNTYTYYPEKKSSPAKISPADISGDDGWTFMETLIVIAIVLVLTASVGFMAVNSLERARRAAAHAQIDSFAVALEAYYIDSGFYPTAEQGLDALRTKPLIEPVSPSWNGPYLYKAVPRDPWGNPYIYTIPGIDGNPYGIKSFGRDKKEGGEDVDADISSWEN